MNALATLEMTDGGMRFTLCAAVLAPAALLALRRSSYLIDYYIVVVCLNRLVRRLLDWSEGQYDDKPITSLLAMVIGGFAALAVLSEYTRLGPRLQRVVQYLGAALGYAFVVGLGNGTGAVFALMDYVMPFGLMLYGAAIRVDVATFDRWIKTMGVCAIGVALYGWYQWAVVPAWDETWLNWSKMWSSMGQPIPFQMGICSTLESRGPFAWFMAAAALPMIAANRWRRVAGWAGVAMLVAVTLPSTVRSSWAILLVGAVAYAALRGGTSLFRVGVVLVGLVAGGMSLVSYLPESERLIARAESVTDLQNDGSFQGRVEIATAGFGVLLSRPQGYGLGSTGMSGKVGGQAGVIGDNGVWELVANFGAPGLVLLFAGFGILVTDTYRTLRATRSEHACLALAQLCSGVAGMVFANWLSGPYAGLSLMTFGAVLAQTPRTARSNVRAAAPRSASSPTAKPLHVRTSPPSPSP
ncbi:MAG: O-antigen ligase family protein [Lacipirellulaceae bacterium]